MTETNKAVQVPEHLIPSTAEVVKMYEERGGKLNNNPNVGSDPIAEHEHLQESREYLFHSRNPSFEVIFSDVVHGEIDTFVNAIQSFIQISSMLASV